jgi:DNA-nicking Smr family endonuclease
MKRRVLRPDEKALWARVAETAIPMAADRLPAQAPKKPTPKPASRRAMGAAAPLPPLVRRPVSAPAGHDLQPDLSDQFAQSPLQMDKKTFAAMKRGKTRPEGRLDLHGMTLDRAHPALMRFVLGAHMSGKRLVLVITGKGKARDDGGPIPVRFGVLRHQVPQWLAMPPLASVVLQVAPAHASHGGSGAYYVYLRRNR